MERNVRLLSVATAFRSFGAALYSPFIALFLSDVLHIDYVEIALIIFAVGALGLPFNLLGGLVTDRIGRRQMILLGLAAEALATAGLAYAFAVRSLPDAIAAGAAGTVIATAAGPALAAYVADVAVGAERTRGFTWFRIGFNAGYSGGITLAGLLVASVGFAVSAGVGSALIGGTTIVLAALLRPSPYDIRLSTRGRPPAAGAAPAPGRTMRESLRLIVKDRGALELMVAWVLASLTLGQWGITFPLYVHNILGVPFWLLGAGLALNGLLVVFGQTPTTHWGIGRRHTSLAILGVLLYLAAFLGLGAAGLLGVYPAATFVGAVVLLTIGENLESIPQMTLPSNLAPFGETGAYNGAFGFAFSIGFLAAVLLGGVVLQLTANPLLIWVLLCAPSVPAILLFQHARGRLGAAADRA